MVTVYFGMQGDEVKSADKYFDSVYEEDWFDDPIVKQMVMDIDKTEIVGPYLAISPVFGAIPPLEISGGVKCLILMYKLPDYHASGFNMGDNCYEWVVKLGEICDCRVSIESAILVGDLSSDQSRFNAIVGNTGEKINTIAEYYDEYYKWIASGA
jgi:hypothetical protein